MLAGIKQELTDLKPRALNLQNALDTERKQREESYNQLLPRLDEKITFLDQTPQLVNHYGDLGAPQDDRVLNMTPNGITQDCSGIVPKTARGAILWVMIGRRGGDGSAHFTFTNSKEQFVPGVSNYSKIWVGGLVFCPFYEGQKFRWRLHSNDAQPDPKVGCIGSIIGWF